MDEKIGGVIIKEDFLGGTDLYSDGDVEDELLEIAKRYSENELNQVIKERKKVGRFYIIFRIFEKILYHGSQSIKVIVFWKSVRAVERLRAVLPKKHRKLPVLSYQKTQSD